MQTLLHFLWWSQVTLFALSFVICASSEISHFNSHQAYELPSQEDLQKLCLWDFLSRADANRDRWYWDVKFLVSPLIAFLRCLSGIFMGDDYQDQSNWQVSIWFYHRERSKKHEKATANLLRDSTFNFALICRVFASHWKILSVCIMVACVTICRREF